MQQNHSPKVYIITPAFNAQAHILNFLKSVSAQTYSNISVIIIDDGSTDETVDLVVSNHPDIIVLKGSGDLWWSGCTNKGVDYALSHKADFIFTVNNDVSLDKDCVKNLVEYSCAQHELILAGATVYDMSDLNTVWYFGGIWDRKKGDLKHRTGTVNSIGLLPTQADWLTGMGALIPTKVFREIGTYNAKKFPQYFGDTDFSIRAHKSGYKLMVLPQARVYADLSSSWLEKWLAKPRLSFLYNILFSKRSQFNLIYRWRFYKQHWGKGYVRAMVRFYFITLYPTYRLWFKRYVNSRLGRI